MNNFFKWTVLIFCLLDSSFAFSQTIDSRLNQQIEEVMKQEGQLSPVFWQNQQFNPAIKKELNKLADNYFKLLSQLLPGVQLKDVLFVGSLASYRYTKDSDIDLHLLIQPKNPPCDPDLYKKYLKQLNDNWHLSNIKIHHIPTQITLIQDSHESGGIYSLKNNQWLKKPEYDSVKFSKVDLLRAIEKYQSQLNQLKQTYLKDPQNFDCQQFPNFLSQLAQWRIEGLKKNGLVSVENMAYRVMRNLGDQDSAKKLYLECINLEYAT